MVTPLRWLCIETTNLCQLNCVMCLHHGPFYQGQVDTHPKNMVLGVFKYIVNQYCFLHSSPKHLTPHFQGEPLCYPHFEEASEYIEARGMTQNITTNAMFLTREISKLIISLKGYTDIAFSVDGVTKKTFESIRVGSDFDRVMNNIDTFLEVYRDSLRTNLNISVNFVRMEENEREYFEFLRYWVKRKSIHTRSSICTDEEGLPQRLYWTPERKPCLTPNYFSVVLTNLDVIPCCRDHQYKMVMGNLTNQSLEEVWEGEKYQALREHQKTVKPCSEFLCSNCSTWMTEYAESLYRVNIIDGCIFIRQGPFWEVAERL